MASASTRVLRLQELQDNIFSFVDKPDLLNCALVSKSWSEPALDNLWAESDNNIFHLFKILDPVRPVGAPPYLF